MNVAVFHKHTWYLPIFTWIAAVSSGRWWGCCITEYVASEYQGIGVQEMNVRGMLHPWRPTLLVFPLLGHGIGKDFLCMCLVILLQHWCAECRHFFPSVQFDIA